MRFDPAEPLRASATHPRMGSGAGYSTTDLVLGEWSLTAASWTDRHQHEEINYVVEGELHVTHGGETHVAAAGNAVLVPAGELATYAAPVFARMIFVYGPSTDGHAATDTRYVELEG